MKHHIDNIAGQIAEYKTSVDDTINDTLNRENDTLNPSSRKIGMSEAQRAVYDSVKKDNSITINEIILKTGLSRPTVTRALKSLQEMEMIRRIGSKKTGHWEVIK